MQVVVGHAFHGGYYNRFKPDLSTSCPCGARFKSRKHVIFDCPRHKHARDRSEAIIRRRSLLRLFGTEAGLTILQKFLQNSLAFRARDVVGMKVLSTPGISLRTNF
jgi:hypothetical protein